MNNTSNEKKEIAAFVKQLIGEPLTYAIKSPGTELYDFGFGKRVKTVGYDGVERIKEEYCLHILCQFKVVRKGKIDCAIIYNEKTKSDEFKRDISSLIGKKVKNIEIGSKNELILDFSDYSIEFVTDNNGEESWRFFTAHIELPHVVASNIAIDFE